MKTFSIFFTMLILQLCLAGQSRYEKEITILIDQTLLNRSIQKDYNFTTNILLDPVITDSFLINSDKKKYLSLLETDSIYGVKNPFDSTSIYVNRDEYLKMISNYHYDTSDNNVIIYTREDSERIFKIDYWKEYMDSTGHMTVHLSTEQRDSLFDLEMSGNWKNFKDEYGSCFVSFDIPIFNSDFSIAYLEWTYSCNNGQGKSIQGLYQRIDNTWTILTKNETDWSEK